MTTAETAPPPVETQSQTRITITDSLATATDAETIRESLRTTSQRELSRIQSMSETHGNDSEPDIFVEGDMDLSTVVSSQFIPEITRRVQTMSRIHNITNPGESFDADAAIKMQIDALLSNQSKLGPLLNDDLPQTQRCLQNEVIQTQLQAVQAQTTRPTQRLVITTNLLAAVNERMQERDIQPKPITLEHTEETPTAIQFGEIVKIEPPAEIHYTDPSGKRIVFDSGMDETVVEVYDDTEQPAKKRRMLRLRPTTQQPAETWTSTTDPKEALAHLNPQERTNMEATLGLHAIRNKTDKNVRDITHRQFPNGIDPIVIPIVGDEHEQMIITKTPKGPITITDNHDRTLSHVTIKKDPRYHEVARAVGSLILTGETGVITPVTTEPPRPDIRSRKSDTRPSHDHALHTGDEEEKDRSIDEPQTLGQRIGTFPPPSDKPSSSKKPSRTPGVRPLQYEEPPPVKESELPEPDKWPTDEMLDKLPQVVERKFAEKHGTVAVTTGEVGGKPSYQLRYIHEDGGVDIAFLQDGKWMITQSSSSDTEEAMKIIMIIPTNKNPMVLDGLKKTPLKNHLTDLCAATGLAALRGDEAMQQFIRNQFPEKETRTYQKVESDTYEVRIKNGRITVIKQGEKQPIHPSQLQTNEQLNSILVRLGQELLNRLPQETSKQKPETPPDRGETPTEPRPTPPPTQEIDMAAELAGKPLTYPDLQLDTLFSTEEPLGLPEKVKLQESDLGETLSQGEGGEIKKYTGSIEQIPDNMVVKIPKETRQDNLREELLIMQAVEDALQSAGLPPITPAFAEASVTNTDDITVPAILMQDLSDIPSPFTILNGLKDNGVVRPEKESEAIEQFGNIACLMIASHCRVFQHAKIVLPDEKLNHFRVQSKDDRYRLYKLDWGITRPAQKKWSDNTVHLTRLAQILNEAYSSGRVPTLEESPLFQALSNPESHESEMYRENARFRSAANFTLLFGDLSQHRNEIDYLESKGKFPPLVAQVKNLFQEKLPEEDVFNFLLEVELEGIESLHQTLQETSEHLKSVHNADTYFSDELDKNGLFKPGASAERTPEQFIKRTEKWLESYSNTVSAKDVAGIIDSWYYTFSKNKEIPQNTWNALSNDHLENPRLDQNLPQLFARWINSGFNESQLNEARANPSKHYLPEYLKLIQYIKENNSELWEVLEPALKRSGYQDTES